MRKIFLAILLVVLMAPLAGCVVYDGYGGAYYAPAPVYYRAYPYPYYYYRPYYGYYGYRYRYGY